MNATQRHSPRLVPWVRHYRERTAEGILLRPLKPEPSKAKPSGGKHLRRKGGFLSGPDPFPT